MEYLLEVDDLHTYFKTKKGIVKAVNGVSYQVEAGKTLGIVGESGSGKSVSAMSILKLLDGNGYIDSGTITFKGRNLAECTKNDMYQIRGNEISVIFQEPMTSLNPVPHHSDNHSTCPDTCLPLPSSAAVRPSASTSCIPSYRTPHLSQEFLKTFVLLPRFPESVQET